MPAAARDALEAMERMASTGFNYGRLTRKGVLWYLPTPKLGLFYLDDGRTLIVVDIVRRPPASPAALNGGGRSPAMELSSSRSPSDIASVDEATS